MVSVSFRGTIIWFSTCSYTAIIARLKKVKGKFPILEISQLDPIWRREALWLKILGSHASFSSNSIPTTLSVAFDGITQRWVYQLNVIWDVQQHHHRHCTASNHIGESGNNKERECLPSKDGLNSKNSSLHTSVASWYPHSCGRNVEGHLI